MKKLILTLCLLTPTVALADKAQSNEEVLTCSFTEPFFTVSYDSETGVISYVGAENFNEETGEFETVILSTDGDLQAAPGENEYVLVDESGETLVALTLDFQGSDGMSDFVYPFSARYGEALFGGCETTSAPAVNPYELIERLRR